MPRQCDWGRACDCSECKPAPSEKCDVCRLGKGLIVVSIFRKDRKGIAYYDFKTYCASCYNKFLKPEKEAYFNLLCEMVEK